MSWHRDLAFGQSYEKIAIGLLEDGDVTTPPPGKHSPWDFKHNQVAFECKADRRAHTTGNLCIEYEHTGVPSGLSITEADYWLYFIVKPDGYSLLKIPTSVLRASITDGTRRWYTDGGNSRFYLLPVVDFKQYVFKEKQA
jgi:hypothetical protein